MDAAKNFSCNEWTHDTKTSMGFVPVAFLRHPSQEHFSKPWNSYWQYQFVTAWRRQFLEKNWNQGFVYVYFIAKH